jgi:hypothetical protein
MKDLMDLGVMLLVWRNSMMFIVGGLCILGLMDIVNGIYFNFLLVKKLITLSTQNYKNINKLNNHKIRK